MTIHSIHLQYKIALSDTASRTTTGEKDNRPAGLSVEEEPEILSIEVVAAA